LKVFNHRDVKAEDVGEGAFRVRVKWLIDEKVGAENFAMRLFEVEPGGYTPYHKHPWEHEVFVLEGDGVVVGVDGEKGSDSQTSSLRGPAFYRLRVLRHFSARSIAISAISRYGRPDR